MEVCVTQATCRHPFCCRGIQCPDADLRVFVVPLCPGVCTLVCARALVDAEKKNPLQPRTTDVVFK